MLRNKITKGTLILFIVLIMLIVAFIMLDCKANAAEEKAKTCDQTKFEQLQLDYLGCQQDRDLARYQLLQYQTRDLGGALQSRDAELKKIIEDKKKADEEKNKKDKK